MPLPHISALRGTQIETVERRGTLRPRAASSRCTITLGRCPMKPHLVSMFRLIVLAGLLAGCAPAPLAEPTTTADRSITLVSSPVSTTPAPAVGVQPPSTFAAPSPTATPNWSVERAAITAVRQAVAQRLGVDAESVVVQSVKSREWPDSSLGCPQRGAVYLQVITPGYLIVVEAGGKKLEYHTNKSGVALVLCSER